MSKYVKLIKEIDKKTKNWTSKVLVVEKSIPRKARNSSTRYQKLILLDTEGTRIQASILNDDINLFENTLKVLHYYYISNATVKLVRPEYRLVDNNFEWTINEMTMIEDVNDLTTIADPHTYNLLIFNNILTPQILSYDNKSNTENFDIDNISSTSTIITVPNVEQTILIKEVPNMPKNENNFWIKTAISVINLHQKFWYATCSQCHKTTDSECDQIYTCSYYEVATKTIPRCRVDAELYDVSGMLVTTLFAENAERALKCFAEQLMQNTIAESVRNLRSIATLTSKIEYMIHLKVTKSEYRGATHFKYIVLSLCDLPDTASSSKLCN